MIRAAEPDAAMGAEVVRGGATFRVWAPTAEAVHLALLPPGQPSLASWAPSQDNKLVRDEHGFWSGFVEGAEEGWQYRYWTVGPAGQGHKRDPPARELEHGQYPDCHCLVRGSGAYPWHDASF